MKLLHTAIHSIVTVTDIDRFSSTCAAIPPRLAQLTHQRLLKLLYISVGPMCTKSMDQALQKMTMWFRRLLPRKNSRPADDHPEAANMHPKQTSTNSSVTELTHHSQHAQDNSKTCRSSQRRTKEEIANLNSKYPSRTGMLASSEYQLMVSGDP